MHREAAVAHLVEHRELVAHAIALQIAHTVPKYRQLDVARVAANVDAVMEGVMCLLVRSNPVRVTRVMDLLVALHEKRGFAPADFIVAVLCALPVLRRFFVHYAETREQGMELYEAVEAILIPLYGHLVMRLSDGFEEESTESDVTAPMASRQQDPELDALPFEIVSVEQVMKLKADRILIEQERDQLVRELQALRKVAAISANGGDV